MIREKPMMEDLIQVAHDIRSPLFALRAILNSQDPLNHKRLLLSVSQRVQDIADSLWATSKRRSKDGAVDVYPLIKEVVEEKKFLNPNHIFFLKCSRGIRSHIDSPILQRVLSNLINNSITACQGKVGVIFIKVDRLNNAVVISVKDNGNGMKHSEINGAFKKGLGLSWARKTLREIGGTIQLSSSSMGTKVSIVIY